MKRVSPDKIKNGAIIILYILFIFVVWFYVSKLIDKEAVRNFVSSYGILAPIIFILIQIFQNIVAPITHYPILLAGGLLFGPVLGFIYNWIGTVIGTILIILLVKKFGRSLVNKVVSKKFMEKYNRTAQKIGPWGYFIMLFLPGFPDDEISYLVGLSKLSLRSIFPAIIFGKMGGAASAFIGSDPVKGIMPMFVANGIVSIGALLVYFKNHIPGLKNIGRPRRVKIVPKKSPKNPYKV